MSECILERHGCPIHYWLEGDPNQALVVFTHGAGADHRMFEDQISALQNHFSTLTWDVRGHGQSRPVGKFNLQLALEDLISMLDAIGRREAVFVGQSMGGNILQELVRQHPDRVRALVLVDCVCNSTPLGWFERFALKITPAMLALYPYNTLISQSAKASALRPEVQQYLDHAMRVMTKFELETVLLETTNILRDDPEYRIAKPFLLLRGDHDNAGAIAKQAKTWASREAQCQDYIIVPKAGHCSNQDNPAFFNRVLLEFLGRMNQMPV